MTTARSLLLAAILLVASWLQAGLSARIALFHARPDFILTTLVCISVLIGNLYGTVQSLWAGFLTAVLAGFNYGSVMVSRLLTGFLCGSLQQHIIQDSPFIPLITVFLATWLCEGLYFLMAPNLHYLRWWTHMVLGESIYNSILSVPIYFGLRALKFGGEADDGFSPFVETI